MPPRKWETDPSAKALKGFGGRSVTEMVTPDTGDTWRTVYTTRNRMLCTCGTCSGRNRRLVSGPRKTRLIWPGSGLPKPSATTEKGRIENRIKAKAPERMKSKPRISEGGGNVF